MKKSITPLPNYLGGAFHTLRSVVISTAQKVSSVLVTAVTVSGGPVVDRLSGLLSQNDFNHPSYKQAKVSVSLTEFLAERVTPRI